MNKKRQKLETKNMEKLLKYNRENYINKLNKTVEDWENNYQETELKKYVSKFKNSSEYLCTAVTYLSIKTRIQETHINKTVFVPNISQSDYIECCVPTCTSKYDVNSCYCWIPSEYAVFKKLDKNKGIIVPLCPNHTYKSNHDNKFFENIIRTSIIPYLNKIQLAEYNKE